MRSTALLLLSALLASVLAPAIVVGGFLLQRERIMSELCVQRLVPDDMRTCHGDCYLSRTLRKVDAQERRLPDALRSMRLPDSVTDVPVVRSHVPTLTTTCGARPEDGRARAGWPRLSDPVP